jgi:hypothetical protein
VTGIATAFGLLAFPIRHGDRISTKQLRVTTSIAKKITWWQAAEIIGISDRQMRRCRERYEQFGIRGLYDRRRGRPLPKRVPLAEVEKVLQLYRGEVFRRTCATFTRSWWASTRCR